MLAQAWEQQGSPTSRDADAQADTVAALIRSDTLAACSRLLAADLRRGSQALLDPVGTLNALSLSILLPHVAATVSTNLLLPPCKECQVQQASSRAQQQDKADTESGRCGQGAHAHQRGHADRARMQFWRHWRAAASWTTCAGSRSRAWW